ncbi:serine hydrolase [Arthrobacter sp. H-02-3]|uniref:serine hydrolase n=1 Tax=Arthrobacter sp. H-02-3 TaxID=2703675 RepID=UPI000DD19728|nr:serine hydrolase [Arthrobacter sp. H-02-3]PVZ52283.1 serine hydrolase [Arthrobacter sp. H-02-3]
MTTPGPRPAAPHHRRNVILVWAAAVLVLAAVVVFGAIRTGPSPEGDFLTVSHRQARSQSAAAPAPSPRAAVDLPAEIQRIIGGHPDHRIGVAIMDTSDGALQSYGDVAPYTAASTAKVLTAAAYYHLVETGEKSLDTQLGAFTAAFQLKAMINTSSDDSWILLMQDIGYPRLSDFAATLGITYDPEQNLLAPADMARLLQQLSTGKLLNTGHTAELLGYMQHTNDEDLIPAAVSPEITVHHKYGVVEGYVHDAALLSAGDRSYAVVIYTWGPDDADSAARLDLIHELTHQLTGALFGQ